MSIEATSGQESTDLEPRDRRALTRYVTVLDNVGRARRADGLYLVVSEHEYLVDAREQTCECKDYQYREPEGGCYHLRRVAFATGEREIPIGVEGVDPQLGIHTSPGPSRPIAADGGVMPCLHGEEWCPGPDGDDLPCFECYLEGETHD